jgi:hypothetical protein
VKTGDVREPGQTVVLGRPSGVLSIRDPGAVLRVREPQPFNHLDKEIVMKKTACLVATMTVLAVTGLWAADPVDFSGTWILDQTKTGAGEEFRMDAAKITVRQTADSISIDRFVSGPMGDFTISDRLTLDGKECSSETQFGPRKSTASWSEDKKQLTINTTIVMNWEGQESTMKTTDVLSLDEAKTALTLKSKSDSPMGARETTAYYGKGQ